jgi:hypothetical protein
VHEVARQPEVVEAVIRDALYEDGVGGRENADIKDDNRSKNGKAQESPEAKEP